MMIALPFHALLRRMAFWIAALCMLLGGCATTTIQSEVTAFHEWPARLPDKSFVFERSAEQQNDLEYRNYENLVRGELHRLGFTDAADARAAHLKVTMQYSISVRDMRVIEPVLADPWYGSPYLGPRWTPFGYYDPFYDPFLSVPPVTTMRDVRFQLYTRQLKIGIAEAAGRKLYDVTVRSEGTNGSLAAVMPYMIRSAFEDFPGKSGVPRRVEMKMKD